MEFAEIVNIMFKNKYLYPKITDEDKEKAFFIINHKFAIGQPKEAQELNNKLIDRASGVDFWFKFFHNQKIVPYWFWSKSEKEKSTDKKISKSDKFTLMEYEDLNERDYKFLEKYYTLELNEEIKKLKRFKND